MNDGAQVAMVDAIIFMILISLASGIVLSSGVAYRDTGSQRQYNSDFADTLLSVDIEMYGSIRPICGVLCDNAIFASNDAGPGNGSWEEEVLSVGDSIIRPGLGWAVESRVPGSQGILISSFIGDADQLPDDRFASQRTYEVGGESVIITVFTWVSS